VDTRRLVAETGNSRVVAYMGLADILAAVAVVRRNTVVAGSADNRNRPAVLLVVERSNTGVVLDCMAGHSLSTLY